MKFRSTNGRLQDHRGHLWSKAVTCAVAASALALTVTSASSGATPKRQKLTTVTMVMTYPAGYEAPIIEGVALGFFKNNGINLEVSTPSDAGGPADIPLVAEGQFDVGFVTPYQLPVYLQKFNDDVVDFYTWVEDNPACIFVKDSTGITSPSQLAGKSVGAGAASGSSQLIKLLEADGLSSSQINLDLVNNSTLNGVFLSNAVVGEESYYFDAAPAIQAQGIKFRSFCADKVPGFNYMSIGFGATPSFINHHLRIMHSLVLGFQEAFAYANKHPVYVATDFEKQYGPVVGSIGENELEIKDTTPFEATPNDKGHPLGWMSPKDWVNTLAYDVTNSGLNPGFNPKLIYTDQFFSK